MQPPDSPPAEPTADATNPNLLRDRLANERTFLAWLRTGITITALGFVVARFEVLLFEVARIDDREFDESELAIAIGLLLVAAGPLLTIIAAIRYLQSDRSLRAGGDGMSRIPSTTVLVMAMVLALSGVGLIGHLIARWPS